MNAEPILNQSKVLNKMGRKKDLWAKQAVSLVQKTFRITNHKSHWLRIGSGYVPCLQGSPLQRTDRLNIRTAQSYCEDDHE